MYNFKLCIILNYSLLAIDELITITRQQKPNKTIAYVNRPILLPGNNDYFSSLSFVFVIVCLKRLTKNII